MKVLLVPHTGPDAAFAEAELARPELRPGHLLVRVAAAGLNPIDCKLKTRGGPLLPEPPVLGCDFAGTVEAVASDVRGFAVGDAVYGLGGGVKGAAGGSLAEALLVDAALVSPKPRTVSMREAAAVPLVALTAWEGLQRCALVSGQRVLVRGGAGSVGQMAIQLAVQAGARVDAIVRGDDAAEFARSAGAQEVVATESLGHGAYDIVFDAAGAPDLKKLVEAARPGGQLVLISGAGAADLATAMPSGLTVHFVFIVQPLVTGLGREAHGLALRQIAGLIDEGSLRLRVDPRRFTLAEAAEAFRAVEQGNSAGKIVVDIAND